MTHQFNLLLLLISMAVTACTSVQVDKREWQSISCSGFKTWDACMRQASSACPKGFDIRNKIENQVTQARTMDFTCK